MTPSEVKQLTPDGYGGDFEMTGQADGSMLQKCDKSAVFACKNVIPDINLSDYTLEPFYEQNVLRGYLLKKKGVRDAKAN